MQTNAIFVEGLMTEYRGMPITFKVRREAGMFYLSSEMGGKKLKVQCNPANDVSVLTAADALALKHYSRFIADLISESPDGAIEVRPTNG